MSVHASNLRAKGNKMQSKRVTSPILSGLVWSLGLGLGLGGCFLSPVPDTRSPVDHAHEVEPRCKAFSDAATAQLFSPDAVDRVEPAYSYVATGSDRRANLRGAAIHVRPLPGMSPESMTRSLECHQASITLGGAQASADDPYVLPGRWLDLDVSSEGDGFVAYARIDSIADARLVLDRARRFAARPAAPTAK
jgi:hypothetical protein